MTASTTSAIDVSTINNNIGALPKAVHDIAVRDSKVYKSAKDTRAELVTALRKLGKLASSFDPDADPAFYREMMAISREVVAEKASDKGLTAQEKLDLPNGQYLIAPLVDKDVKPAALPPFLTESGRIGKDSIRKYWQQQCTGWFTSVRNSMLSYEKALEMASNPNARTANHAELQAKAINGIIKREQACEDTSQVLLANELTYLIKLSERLASEHGTPKHGEKK